MTSPKFAIINSVTKEFYPDPVYTDVDKVTKKIKYLHEYRAKNNMEHVQYGIELLTKERLEQHNAEWRRFCYLID